MGKGFSVVRRVLAVMVVAAVLLVSFPLYPSVEAAFAVPFEVVTDTGEYLSVVNYNNVYGLYLPGYVDRKSVSVWYSGYGKLKCPAGDVSPGQTGRFDLSADTYTFEETTVDGTRTYQVRVMGGSASVSSLYVTLDPSTSLSWIHSSKENKGFGQLRMLSGKGQEIYNGGLDTFKCRGTTSFTQPGLAPGKKSYAIKLANKAELIEGAGKMKKWALIHMRVCNTFYYDWTGLANLLGYQTYAALAGEGYANVSAQYVDVYVDGAYMGVYILTERVDINAAVDITDTEEYVSSSSDDYRVNFDFNDPAMQAGIRYYQYTDDAVKKQDFDITGGYLLEVNTGQLEENCGFETNRGMLIDIKVPEVCTKEQVSYIAGYFQLFENALYSESGYNEEGKHYSEYVDLDSLASLMITCAFYKNWELFRTSTYMYLDTADSDHPKLTFGPAWDFETGAHMYETDYTFYSKHQLYVDTQSQCYNIIGQLSTKGDYQQLMYEKQQELKKITNAIMGSGKYEGITHVNTLWRSAVDSLEMNWARWAFEDILDQVGGIYAGHENDYAYYAQVYVEALKTRRTVWNALWDEQEYLLGLDVSKTPEDGKCTLTAKISGDADNISWYRLQADNTLLPIAEAKGNTYTATGAGTYYCIATGDSNVFYAEARSDILNSPVISFTSAPVILTETDFVKPMPMTTTKADSKPGGGGFATMPNGGATTTQSKRSETGDADSPSGTGTVAATGDVEPSGANGDFYSQTAQLVLSSLAAILPAAVVLSLVQVFVTLFRQNGFGLLFTWGIPTLLSLLRQLFGK